MSENALELRLSQLDIYKIIDKKCHEEKTLEVLLLIKEMGLYSINKLKTVIKNMPEFTLHDEEHIFNMLRIVQKIVPKTTLENLSTPELMMIFLTIFIHDIGMAPSETLIRAWKGQLSAEEVTADLQNEIDAFFLFRSTYTHQIFEIENFNLQKEYSKAQLLEDYIVTEYIRINHTERAKRIIADDWAGRIKYKETDLTSELATICFSHNEDYTFLLNMESLKLCDQDTYLCIPFVAVILRLADIIDFDPKRTPSVLFSHLAVKNPVSLSEWRKHQSINAWTISSKKLVFSAQCNHPAIEATIHSFCDLIDNELRNNTVIISNISDDGMDFDMSKYKIQLPPRVDRKKISAEKDIVTGKPIYRYHDTKFSLNKKQVIDLLMGTKLYGKPEFALRELLQNSIDACLLRQKLCEKWGDAYLPRVIVSLFNENGLDYLQVKDNGIGMNQHIIDNYYTNIGYSYYASREFNVMMAGLNSSFTPISKFGIGILSCFMVCDSMEVSTRRIIDRFQCDDPLKITIEGYDSLFVISDSKEKEPGTNTILSLRPVHPWEKMTPEKFIECVKNIVPNPSVEINIVIDKYNEIHSINAYEKLDLSPLQDYTWREDRNIQKIEIDLSDKRFGFKGKACIACIVKNGTFVESIRIQSREVVIEGETYTLSSDIKYGSNCITKYSTRIEVNEDGEITEENPYTETYKSKSALSIHGIEVPCSLFFDFSNWGSKTVLKFPFPITFRLDIGGSNDLNLNSSRTLIIYDEKWLSFEKAICEVIYSRLRDKLGKRWCSLERILLKHKNSEISF